MICAHWSVKRVMKIRRQYYFSIKCVVLKEIASLC